MEKHKIVIIGAGPCGLGAAHRLLELGETDFKVFERNSYSGGLATSFCDKQGFWWDIGGHVQFSHYTYFDALMDSLLGTNWLTHERESWVWILDRFVPYPFQLNIHRLPQRQRDECLTALKRIHQNPPKHKPKNFEEWILHTSGEGIAKYFMIPYNFKVWAYPPKEMNAVWVGERVAVTDVTRVENNIKNNTDDVSWGPNNTFRFPKKGGTGAIWHALGDTIGKKYISYNQEVVKVDTQKQLLTLHNGTEVSYEYLISTEPLDQLVLHSDLPQKTKIQVQDLKHSTTHIVGVGLNGKPKAELAKKCWMYFPENNCPFYRVTLFSHYSPDNVPDIATQWSLMTETSQSPVKKVNEKELINEVIEGLYATKLITTQDKIASIWQYKTEYGYPTPSLDRDAILESVQPQLEKRNIYSRGRFGMWKYEVSNQDHSLMQGVEVADYILNKTPERTAWHPDLVNAKKK